MSSFAETTSGMMPRGAIQLRQEAYPGYTLRDLLTSVFFHKRALLIAFLVPTLLGLAAALLSHPVFVSQARLLVLLGNDYVFQPSGATAGSSIALDRDQIVEGELEILQSTTLAAQTLQAVGPATVYPHADFTRPNAMQAAAEQLEKDLGVSAVPESNVIELSFRSYSPTVAAQVLKTLIDLYLQRREAIFSRGTTSTADDQRLIFAKRLADAEDTLAAFSDAHGISDFDNQVGLLLQRKSSAATDRASNEQQVAQLSAQVAALKTRLAGLPATVELYADSSRSPSQQGLGDELAKMQAWRSQLAARYQPGFPLLRDADNQIAAMQSQIGRTPAAASDGGRHGVNPVFQDLSGHEIDLDAQLAGLQGRRAELDTTATDIQTRLDELNTLGQEYRNLRRQRDALDETYRNYLHETEQTQLSSALERSRAANIRIVQPPEPPAHGTSLRMLIAVAGGVLGGVAAAAVLVLLVTMRQSFVTIRDAELALDLPVLIAVPLRGGR